MKNPFNLLHPRVRELIDKLGFHEPTPIQKIAIPKIIKGENALLIAPTGSGKTEACLFPIFSKILEEVESGNEGVFLIYINPLKALTRDLHERILNYTTFLGIKVRPIFGDVKGEYKKPTPEVLITTPESLEKILDISPRWWTYLKNVKFVVIDEIGELANSKRGIQLTILLERLKRITQHKLQRIGLTASVSQPELIGKLFGGSDGELQVIKAVHKKSYHFRVYGLFSAKEKESKLVNLLSDLIDKRHTLLFVNSRYCAEKLHYLLSQSGFEGILPHHGSLEKEERELIETKFKEGLINCVIATKTLELGVDIGKIQQVIQFESPGRVDTLLQRAGRSGHKPDEPAKCSIVTTKIWETLEVLSILDIFHKNRKEEFSVISKPLDVVAKEIMGMILQNFKARKRKKVPKGCTYSIDDIFKTIRQCMYFKDLSRREFYKILEILKKNGLVKTDQELKPGRMFWKLWPFVKDETISWSREFREFFSMIPKRDFFEVIVEEKMKRRKIGTLDFWFVYNYLRPGMTIKLGPTNIKVKEIDETARKVFAIYTSEEGEIPYWRGGEIPTSIIVSSNICNVIDNLENFSQWIRKEDLNKLRKILQIQRKKTNIPSLNRIVIEKVGENITVFLTTFGEKINRTISSLIVEKMLEMDPLTNFIVTPYGFAIISKHIDPIEVLKDVNSSEIENVINNFLINHSGLTKLFEEELSYHFGTVFRKNFGIEFVRNEAIRQIKELFFDINGSKTIIRRIKKGVIKLLVSQVNTPSPLAEEILRHSKEKPFGVDLSKVIEKYLSHEPLTLSELKDVIFENEEVIKNALDQLSIEKNILAITDFSQKDYFFAKVKSKGEWRTIKVPCKVSYILPENWNRYKISLLKNWDTFWKIVKKRKLEEVRISVRRTREKHWFKFKIPLKEKEYFETFLEMLIKTRFQRFEKIDLKIHIAKVPITFIYHNAPTIPLKEIVFNLLSTISLILDAGKLKKYQVTIELP